MFSYGEESPVLKSNIKEDLESNRTHFQARSIRKQGRNALVVLENYMKGRYGKRLMKLLTYSEFTFQQCSI